jgi:hypothetical protein
VESIDVLSTRLFPKNHGATGYELTGIAARCDWVVLSDEQEPRVTLVRRVAAAPRHVFLSLRSPFVALSFFAREVLPLIQSPVILVSGSEDVTVPHQVDRRWAPFDAQQQSVLRGLLADARISHWFAENLDERCHFKLSPLPVGMVFPQPGACHRLAIPAVPPLGSRRLRALCGHRVREGAQWDLRRGVSQLCRDDFAAVCTILKDEVPESRFVELVEQHAFVICAEGGGLDPSPKAWQALLHGAIPVIRRSAQSQAYARLPVAYVEEWAPGALSLHLLQSWRDRLLPEFDDPVRRRAVLQRLSIDYWWALICAHVPATLQLNG